MDDHGKQARRLAPSDAVVRVVLQQKADHCCCDRPVQQHLEMSSLGPEGHPAGAEMAHTVDDLAHNVDEIAAVARGMSWHGEGSMPPLPMRISNDRRSMPAPDSSHRQGRVESGVLSAIRSGMV